MSLTFRLEVVVDSFIRSSFGEVVSRTYTSSIRMLLSTTVLCSVLLTFDLVPSSRRIISIVTRKSCQVVRRIFALHVLRAQNLRTSFSACEEKSQFVFFVRRNVPIRFLRAENVRHFFLMTFLCVRLADSGGFCYLHDLKDVIK